MALFLASFLGVEARKVKARVFFFFFSLHKAVFYFYFNNTSRVGSHDISFISFSEVHSRIMVGTTRQQHTPFFLLCLFFLYMARARNTRDSTIPTPPSWGPTFSVAYLATVR